MEATRRAKFDRVRLLSTELDELSVDASQRASSVNNKASFLAVSAGVLVAASTSHLWTALAWLGALALALSCAALLCAAIASRPGRRRGIVAQRLVDRYLDSTLSTLSVEELIVRDKAAVIAGRETDLQHRAKWVWVGSLLLAGAATSLLGAFSLEILGG